jgi:hypothetical protein
MARPDLTEAEMRHLERWAQVQSDREKGDNVMRAVAELRLLRERESATRFLSELDQEI